MVGPFRRRDGRRYWSFFFAGVVETWGWRMGIAEGKVVLWCNRRALISAATQVASSQEKSSCSERAAEETSPETEHARPGRTST